MDTNNKNFFVCLTTTLIYRGDALSELMCISMNWRRWVTINHTAATCSFIKFCEIRCFILQICFIEEICTTAKKTFKRLWIRLWKKLLSKLYVYLIRSLTLMFHHNDKFRVFFVLSYFYADSRHFKLLHKVNRRTNSLYFLVKLPHYKSLRRKLFILPPSTTNSSIGVQKPRGIMNIARVAFDIWSIVTCTWLH